MCFHSQIFSYLGYKHCSIFVFILTNVGIFIGGDKTAGILLARSSAVVSVRVEIADGVPICNLKSRSESRSNFMDRLSILFGVVFSTTKHLNYKVFNLLNLKVYTIKSGK